MCAVPNMAVFCIIIIIIIIIVVVNSKIFWFHFYDEEKVVLLDDLKKVKRYWNLSEEAIDPTFWRSRLGRIYGPVAKQSTWQSTPSLLKYHELQIQRKPTY